MDDLVNARLRERPVLWDDPEPEGVLSPFEGAGEAVTPNLLGMPTIAGESARRPDAIADAGPAVIALLDDIGAALQRAVDGGRAWRRRIDHLPSDERKALLDALGGGEVSMVISRGAAGEGDVQISESALPGVWIGRAEDEAGAVRAMWVEVADAPKALREAAAARPRRDLALEALTPPRDAMNVMGVLAELRARASEWRPGAPNHVMNFTLLPMTEADTAFLAKIVGEAGVRVSSGGYGAARVIMTALRNVWAVQYLNGLGAVILDTIEIGDVPDAVLAAREDFEDSRARLQEIREAYLP